MGKMYYWLKLNKDFFHSKRIKKLRKLAGGDTFTIIYLKMQLMSLQTDGFLEYTGLEPTFAEEVALDIDEEPENVALTIQYLMANELLKQVSEDEFELTYVKECIGHETASTIRSRKCRKAKKIMEEEQKALQCNTNATDVQHLCNVEIEKEIEIEKDIIISKDIIHQKDYPIEIVISAWNTLSEYGIPKVSRISKGSARYKSLNKRIVEHGVDEVLKAIENVKHSDFLLGRTNTDANFFCFDWFVKPNNFLKVLEGNYLNKDYRNNQRNGNVEVIEEDDKWQ